MLEIGARVKSLRKARHVTLTELSEATELSVGFLSNLERGQTSPTISALHTICNALDITLNDLINDDIPSEVPANDSSDNKYSGELNSSNISTERLLQISTDDNYYVNNNVSIVRHDERLPLFDQDNGSLHYDALTTGTSSIKGTSMIISGSDIYPFQPHALDELGIIVSGALEIIIDNQSHYLYPGDTILIKSGTMHSGRKISEDPSVSYWIKIRS